MDFRETWILSDTHGYKQLMLRLFAEAKLTTEDGKWIAPEDVRIVHLGDTVDRGPDSVGVFTYLRDLQKERGPEAVVRLYGNHEAAFMGGPKFGGLDPKVHPIKHLMIEDAQQGLLKAAHHLDAGDTQWLLVHAGLHPDWYGKVSEDSPEKIAAYLNDVSQRYFERYVPRWRYSQNRVPAMAKKHGHSVTEEREVQRLLEQEAAILFGISFSRGGWDKTAGVTWMDWWDEMMPSLQSHVALLEAGQDTHWVPQIVGHTQHERIQILPNKLIGVNVRYGYGQMLRFDHETGEFSTTELLRELD